MKTHLIAALAIVMPLTSALTADKPAKELEKYNRTGQYETCLTSNRIRETQILNSKQILFKMNGDDAYLAEPKSCPGLSRGLALSYDATINQLCNTTIITLLETSSPVPSRGSCGIERFEKLEKKH
jgi:hypothetical protein